MWQLGFKKISFDFPFLHRKIKSFVSLTRKLELKLKNAKSYFPHGNF